MTSAYAQKTVRTDSGGGEERHESARLGEGYKFASATFFRRELNSFGQPAFCLAGNRVATVPLKKKIFSL